jgi:hypothetical protein
MAVVITSQLYGGQTPPAVLVTVTGLSAADLVNVTREPPGSAPRQVRGGLNVVPPPGGTLLLVDVEAELGRPLVYVASYLPTGLGVPVEVSAAPLTVPEPADRHHVLSDPFTGEPLLVDVTYDDDARTQVSRSSLLQAQGQAFPVAITDVRTADSGSLSIYTRDRAETLQLVDLLADGRPVVSRHVNDGCDIPAMEILAVGDATRSRRTRDGDRRWSLPFQVIDTPDPTLVLSLVTLQDLADVYVGQTLNTIATDFPGTLLDLAQDDLGVV